MRQSYLLVGLSVVNAAWLAVCQSTQAEIASSSFKALLPTPIDSEIPALSKLDRSAISIAEWLSQSPDSNSPSLVQIIDIQLNPTESGLDLILNTTEGQFPVVVPSVVGNALIADSPNAVLILPNNGDFQIAKPTEEVALVTVSNLPNNRVRVAITGLNAAPTADVRADATRLIFNVAVEPAITTDSAADNALRIVVTAEKTPELVQDVPISITALTEQDIKDCCAGGQPTVNEAEEG